MAETVLDALRAARAVLDEAGNPTPRVDTELLLAHVLGRPRGQLLTAPPLSEEQSIEFAGLVLARAGGQPLQHLIGTAPFRHLELAVGPGVFIPRPETELILELAAAALAESRMVVDLCAGSGAIALAVAQEYPAPAVWAVERSGTALPWLRRNVDEHGDRVRVVEADVADPGLLPELTGRVDVVLSNPPYVPTGLRSELAVEIRHDPNEAVFAGADGLQLMPAVIETAGRLLRPGGTVIIEHDASQSESLPAMIEAKEQWQQVNDHADLTGRFRFTSAVRTSAG